MATLIPGAHTIASLPKGFAAAEILASDPITPRVRLLTLALDPALLDELEPGSHLELLLPLGDAGEVRHYSICEVTSAGCRIAVLREDAGRGGSAWLHTEAAIGAAIPVRGPRNTFRFSPDYPAQFIAGGIGITPLLTMIGAAERAGTDWQLLYLGRSASDMAFLELLREYGERVTVWASEERGRADLALVFRELPAATHVYACGPEGLHTALTALAEAHGAELTLEDFSAGGEGSPVADSGDTQPFTVELADGSEVAVPAGCSILEALGAAGIRTLSSCKRGTCGTCETPIIAGRVDHRDSVLSPEEQAANETMMICVSRAADERIVLDI